MFNERVEFQTYLSQVMYYFKKTGIYVLLCSRNNDAHP